MKRLFLNFIGRRDGYSGCMICGDTWNWKKSHTTNDSPSSGLFPLCEECWKSSTREQKRAAYARLVLEFWEEDSHWRLPRILEALEHEMDGKPMYGQKWISDA